MSESGTWDDMGMVAWLVFDFHSLSLTYRGLTDFTVKASWQGKCGISLPSLSTLGKWPCPKDQATVNLSSSRLSAFHKNQ
jgi:hypothetical protein